MDDEQVCTVGGASFRRPTIAPAQFTEAERALIDQQEAQQAAAETSTRGSLESQAENALADLRAYRDAASPTNAQTVAIVRVLCRVCIALIRLHLRRLSGGAEAANAPGK